MVGISMVVGINGLTGSFEADISGWINTALGGDLYVRAPLRLRPDMEARLRSLDGVAAVTKARYVYTRIIAPSGQDGFTIFSAIDPATYLELGGFQVQDGPPAAEIVRRLAAGGAIAVATEVADTYSVQVGDHVLLETRRGRQPFEIIAIIVDFSGGETAVVTGGWVDLRRYFGVNDVDRFTIGLEPGASAAALTYQIEEVVGRREGLTVESRDDFEAKVLPLSSQAFALFDVLGLIGLTVATLGIVNTMLMSVIERTRELGGLRSLGMSRRQIRRLILAEAGTVGFIGAIFGVGFGAILSKVFVTGLNQMGGFRLTAQIPYAAMGYSFVIAVVVALIAALYPAVRASRINIVESIKHE
jgi:putative ABC transport system permease protein